jgi:hypothetical protein
MAVACEVRMRASTHTPPQNGLVGCRADAASTSSITDTRRLTDELDRGPAARPMNTLDA